MATTEQFARDLVKMSLDTKMKTLKKIEHALKTNIGPDGNQVTNEQRRDLEQLSRWLRVNILIGNELCSIESLPNY